MLNAEDLGFIPNDPTFDNSLVVANLLANPPADREILFSNGMYYFLTPPPVLNTPLELNGEGVNNTYLVRKYNETDLNKALLHSISTLYVKDLCVWSEGTGGGGIRLEGNLASGSVIENVVVTAGSGYNWHIPLTLHGQYHALGLRTCKLENVELFASTVHGLWIVNTRGLSAQVNVYPAGGTVGHAVIQDMAGNKSENIAIDTYHLPTVWLYNVANFKLWGMGTTLVNNNGSSNVRIY